MRGDSLRDFYAKTLAVVGLGLLAAAGAMVDYWPAGGDVPQVAQPLNLRPATAALMQDFGRVIPAPASHRAHAVVPMAPVASSDVVVLVLNASATSPEAVLPQPAESPAPTDFLVVAGDVPLEWIYASHVLEPAPMLEPVVGMASPGLQGRVTGALKRTKDSIKDARTSIRGALSGMVGAVRRVSPFFSTTLYGG